MGPRFCSSRPVLSVWNNFCDMCWHIKTLSHPPCTVLMAGIDGHAQGDVRGLWKIPTNRVTWPQCIATYPESSTLLNILNLYFNKPITHVVTDDDCRWYIIPTLVEPPSMDCSTVYNHMVWVMPWTPRWTIFLIQITFSLLSSSISVLFCPWTYCKTSNRVLV